MLVWRAGQVAWSVEGFPALKFSGQRSESLEDRGRRGTPNAAKLEINNNLLLSEVSGRITGASRVTGGWSSKSRNIDAACGQGRGYIRSLMRSDYIS